jgi:tetratricopeptide (TPR) repeat protein
MASNDQGLKAAVQHLQSGRPQEAYAVLAALLVTAARDTEVLNLAAMAARQSGRLDDAIAHWRQSIAVRGQQLQVLTSLGHALRAKGHLGEARATFEQALAVSSSSLDAMLGLGLVLDAQGHLEAALRILEQAVRFAPQSGPAQEAIGSLLTRLKRPSEAIDHLDNAARLSPKSPTLPHNRGVALEALKRDEEAEAAFSEAVARNPRQPASWFGLANARQRLGDMAGAIEAHRKAIEISPNFVESHNALNETIWQAGEGGYLASFPWALQRLPNDPPLRRAYARHLNRVRSYEEAERQALEALRLAPKDADALDLLAQALLGKGQVEEAIETFQQALAIEPNAARVCGRLAEAYLLNGRAAEAHTVLLATLAQSPHDQENLARMTVALRLLGAENEYRRLANYEAFVKVIEVPEPPGFKDLASFHAELAPYLLGKHLSKQHPTDQTLRGGTQTLGALFGDPHPLVRHLRDRLYEATLHYVDGLPTDLQHPFLSRKRTGIRFSGSWSVRLVRGGFHTNHIHSEGWISSAYYINLPSDVVSAPDKQGWFKLGETNPDTCPVLPAERWIQPKEGSLVLFPSYFWHGTQVFHRGAERLTVAFDVLPD